MKKRFFVPLLLVVCGQAFGIGPFGRQPEEKFPPVPANADLQKCEAFRSLWRSAEDSVAVLTRAVASLDSSVAKMDGGRNILIAGPTGVAVAKAPDRATGNREFAKWKTHRDSLAQRLETFRKRADGYASEVQSELKWNSKDDVARRLRGGSFTGSSLPWRQ